MVQVFEAIRSALMVESLTLELTVIMMPQVGEEVFLLDRSLPDRYVRNSLVNCPRQVRFILPDENHR